ncbi:MULTISPECIES: CopG family transcriptional regulator [unclassified Massilia]|uniref:CopG family transcriptional regulator n=1 Tax=unclassified Massilia TaxID=2609279 RepID=UPI002101EABF|nr:MULTISPECIES: CopG family transcriptional regulator [unclassified Massilia]UTY58360.1 CopG family transcriptional regulator [Massilia sp. erpn]
MTNTTIQLSAELQAAIAEAAERAGITEQDFILTAINDKLMYDDPDSYPEADRRWEEFLQHGEGIPHEEIVEYFERRAAGEVVEAPRPRKIRN